LDGFGIFLLMFCFPAFWLCRQKPVGTGDWALVSSHLEKIFCRIRDGWVLGNEFLILQGRLIGRVFAADIGVFGAPKALRWDGFLGFLWYFRGCISWEWIELHKGTSSP